MHATQQFIKKKLELSHCYFESKVCFADFEDVAEKYV